MECSIVTIGMYNLAIYDYGGGDSSTTISMVVTALSKPTHKL